MGLAPARGTLTLTVRRAEYEDEYVGDGDPSTYCVFWVLEPTRRRRRRTVVARRTMNAEWHQTFALDDTSAEAKAVIDVWREREGGEDEYFGKVTLPVAQLRATGEAAWYELVQGKLELSASFTRDTSPDQPALSSDEEEHAPRQLVSDLPSTAAPAPRSPAALAPARGEVDEVEAYEEDFEDEPPQPRTGRRLQPADLDANDEGAGVEYYEYTHRGGDGKGPKENQDSLFSVRIDARNYVWGVLDGHGHDNGKVASEAARDSLRAFFEARHNFARLRSEPQATMEEAFAQANEAVRVAILAQPGVFERDGQIVQQMEVDEFCPLGYDVVDGGTTATVAALVDGRTLVVAAVGDSCGVLATCPGGRLSARELIREHSALNKEDYELVGGGGCQFVYEYPDMYEQGHLHVWEKGPNVRAAEGRTRGAKLREAGLRGGGGSGGRTEAGGTALTSQGWAVASAQARAPFQAACWLHPLRCSPLRYALPYLAPLRCAARRSCRVPAPCVCLACTCACLRLAGRGCAQPGVDQSRRQLWPGLQDRARRPRRLPPHAGGEPTGRMAVPAPPRPHSQEPRAPRPARHLCCRLGRTRTSRKCRWRSRARSATFTTSTSACCTRQRSSCST